MSSANRLPQADETRDVAAPAAANDRGHAEETAEARRAKLLATIWSAIDGE